jgi:glycerol uptake facilitator-like aquaporin
MGIMIFGQNFGAATLLTAGDAIFTNSLRKEVAKNVPTVDPEIIIAAGARSIREIVSGDALVGVIQAYSTSVNRVAYLGIGASFVGLLFSLGLSWGRVANEITDTSLEETSKPLRERAT